MFQMPGVQTGQMFRRGEGVHGGDGEMARVWRRARYPSAGVNAGDGSRVAGSPLARRSRTGSTARRCVLSRSATGSGRLWPTITDPGKTQEIDSRAGKEGDPAGEQGGCGPWAASLSGCRSSGGQAAIAASLTPRTAPGGTRHQGCLRVAPWDQQDLGGREFTARRPAPGRCGHPRQCFATWLDGGPGGENDSGVGVQAGGGAPRDGHSGSRWAPNPASIGALARPCAVRLAEARSPRVRPRRQVTHLRSCAGLSPARAGWSPGTSARRGRE